MQEKPIVGLAVLIVNENNEVLLGLRNSELGKNTWAPPGGKLDMFESFEVGISREVKEETDLNISNLVFICVTNDSMEDIGKHYVTLFFSTTEYSGDIKIMEPDKCLEWKWFDPKQLPENLFSPFKNFLNGNFMS
jgi:8-oxo-dGTP diphosphatase